MLGSFTTDSGCDIIQNIFGIFPQVTRTDQNPGIPKTLDMP